MADAPAPIPDQPQVSAATLAAALQAMPRHSLGGLAQLGGMSAPQPPGNSAKSKARTNAVKPR